MKDNVQLTKFELEKLLPIMVTNLNRKVGLANAVTGSKIITGFAKLGYKLTGARVVKIINYINFNDLIPCLVSSNKGYWIDNSLEGLKDYSNLLADKISELEKKKQVIDEKIMKII